MKMYPTDPYCQFRETDFTQDAEIKALFSRGIDAEALTAACLQIQRRERSPVVMLPSDTENRYFSDGFSGGRELHDIRAAADRICSRDHRILFDSIDKLRDTPILLKVSGGFSALMSVTGNDFLFRQLLRSGVQIRDAVDHIHEQTAGLIRQAVLHGVRIISLADPSALPGVMGEKLWLRYSVEPTARLLRLVDPFLDAAVLHLCPRTSAALEKSRLCTCESHASTHEDLLPELLELSRRSDVHFTGHVCIHAGKCPEGGLSVIRLSKRF